jgi:HK97 family phage prohead protease
MDQNPNPPSVQERLADCYGLYRDGHFSLVGLAGRLAVVEADCKAELVERRRYGIRQAVAWVSSDLARQSAGMAGMGRSGLQWKRLQAGPLKHKRLDLKAETKGDTLRMYCLVFSVIDRQGDLIEPGAVKNLDEFLTDGWVALNHNNCMLPVAIPVEATQDEHGMLVVARWHSTPEAQACKTVVEERQAAGKSVKTSVGYISTDERFERVDGQAVRRLRGLRVYECSIVNLPANPAAEVLASDVYGSPPGDSRFGPERAPVGGFAG